MASGFSTVSLEMLGPDGNVSVKVSLTTRNLIISPKDFNYLIKKIIEYISNGKNVNKRIPASIKRSCFSPSPVSYSQIQACSAWSNLEGCCNLWGGMTISSKNPNVTKIEIEVKIIMHIQKEKKKKKKTNLV